MFGLASFIAKRLLTDDFLKLKIHGLLRAKITNLCSLSLWVIATCLQCIHHSHGMYVFFRPVLTCLQITNVVLFCYLVLHSEKTSTYNVVNSV